MSRALTPVEAQWLKDNPGFGGTATEAVTPPPTGPIDPVAEYEPMEGLVISWLSFGGSTASPGILAQITRRVTVEGQGRVYIGVTSATVQSSATSILTAAGADLNRVTFFTVPLNSVWARDYGPRYVYEGDVRVITDHKYNRSTRTSDDNQPVVFSQFRKHQYYDMGLGSTQVVHGGGNYHLNGSGDAYATQLIVNENTPPFNPGTLTEAQIKSIYSSYQNNNLTITAPFPTSVDATQHIDMWMQIYDDDKVFISDWPNNVGSAQDVICDNTAALMQSRGYTVTRIPAYSIGGTHYTYANMVIMNDIVLLPQYNNGPGAAISNQVLATVQAAYTPLGKTVYQINGDGIVTLAGVFHCIVQHVPQHLGLAGVNGGLAPTAYLREIASNTVYSTGQQISVSWISDDDAPVAASGGVQGVDIVFSADGGATFPITIATNQPANGSFTWNIPAGIQTTQGRIKVVARDGLNNTGFDVNGTDLAIDTAAPSITDASFSFETEQRVDVLPSEAATLGGVTLTNTTTAEVLTGAAVTITPNGATISIRKASGLLSDGNWQLTSFANLTDPAGNSTSGTFPLSFFVLAGDATRDRSVNLNDFTMLAANFGETGRVFSEGNFNYDAGVDLNDFTILASQFGKTLPGDLPRAAGRSLPAASAPADRPAVFGTARLDDSRLRALLEENQPFVV